MIRRYILFNFQLIHQMLKLNNNKETEMFRFIESLLMQTETVLIDSQRKYEKKKIKELNQNSLNNSNETIKKIK